MTAVEMRILLENILERLLKSADWTGDWDFILTLDESRSPKQNQLTLRRKNHFSVGFSGRHHRKYLCTLLNRNLQ